MTPAGLFGLLAVAMLAVTAALPASAQVVPVPGSPGIVPPPLPPLPPPRIEVPAVPRLDAPPRAIRPAVRPDSFGDRVTQCLHDAAAADLGPSERAAYSRACANQR